MSICAEDMKDESLTATNMLSYETGIAKRLEIAFIPGNISDLNIAKSFNLEKYLLDVNCIVDVFHEK